ncbi:MAG: hypothetical protein AWM53_00687 [Candidatus Dichloromethanomonas elyunquensis]|nr:MAG: hypothetical protein AWM53_00687 [Candidatus Dichloromethanomonas elyunquensis]
MFDFIKKSPLGFLLTAGAVILALSPEAREGERKIAVKGAAVILDAVDKAKEPAKIPQAYYPGLAQIVPGKMDQTLFDHANSLL